MDAASDKGTKSMVSREIVVVSGASREVDLIIGGGARVPLWKGKRNERKSAMRHVRDQNIFRHWSPCE